MKQLWLPSTNQYMDNIASKTLDELDAYFLGTDQPYQETLELMYEIHERVSRGEVGNTLLLLEHRPVITITRQHLHRSIKTSQDAITKAGIDVIIADRGGDATFHGPGQLVGYPIIDLTRLWLNPDSTINISRYIRSLEQGLLVAIKDLGIRSVLCVPGFTGIWYRDQKDSKLTLKKLVAIGVGIKDGVSKHGFALNIDIDHQRYSEHIVPCGLKDRGVITLKEICLLEQRAMPSLKDIVAIISERLATSFSLKLSRNTAHLAPNEIAQE